jgi:hypothetical protein
MLGIGSGSLVAEGETHPTTAVNTLIALSTIVIMLSGLSVPYLATTGWQVELRAAVAGKHRIA